MGNHDANQAAMQASGQWTECHMSVYVGAVLAEGEFTATPANGATTTAISVSSGSMSDVKPGMVVYVFTAGGASKGRTRVRYSGVIDSAHLPIRENGRGFINIVSGDTFEVRNDVRLSDKLVEANQLFRPDGLAVSDRNADPDPWVNSGGCWAGFEEMLPIPTAGSESFLVDHDSATPVTHLWTLPTGLSFDSGTSTSANPFITGDAGTYLVAHQATDPDNGKSRTQYVPYIIHGPDNPPHDIRLGTPEGNEQSGWSVDIQVFDRASLALIPDEALIIVWKKETINGTVQSFGGDVAGRSHILFVGYLDDEDGEGDGETGVETLTLRALSPIAKLQKLVGYSKVMINTASPDDWSEIRVLTTKRVMLQNLQWYTNWNEAGFDLKFGTYEDEVYSPYFIQEQDTLAQLREVADGTDARVVANRAGRMLIHTRPELLAIGARAAAVKTFSAITTADIIRFSYHRAHSRRVNLLECRGFTAGNNPQPMFSRWPSLSPGTGIEKITVERLIDSNDQDGLNERCGRRGAAEDGIYVDADGELQMAMELDLDFPLSYDVFDFYDEFVVFDHVTALRGIDFGDQLFVLQRANPQFDNDTGTGVLSTTWRTATNGAAGQTYVPPQEESNNLPEYTLPDFLFDPLPIAPPALGNLVPAGTQSLAGYNDDGYFYYCSPTHTGGGFDVPAVSGGPAWARIAISVTGTILDEVQSAFTAGRDIVITDDADAIYTVDWSGLTPTVTLRKTLRAAITDAALQWRWIDASWGANYILVVSAYGNSGADSGVWYTYSTNGGTSWSTETNITAHYSASGGASIVGGFVSSRAPGEAYIGVFTASGTGSAAAATIYKLTGTFASPTSTGVSTIDILPGTIHRSWADNENTMYYGAVDFSLSAALRNFLYRKVGSGSPVDIAPSIGGNKCRPFYARGVHTCPVDANTMLIAASGNGVNGVWMSRDKGTTTTLLTAGTTTDYIGAECAGNNRNQGYVWGYNGAIGFVDLAAQAIDDRMGNIPTDFPSIGRFVRIRGL